ncbi:copper chaperone PCu(A)C [Streptomyces sp. PU-14G]|uniref:copper chaperone PCu(A)C n=1 Tax=Streptomyces sp. PU-14G TaxID=2800808 RepID=UPI0034E04F44
MAAFALALGAVGCGGDDDFSLPDWDAPGQNARVGSLMLRYAHVAEPRHGPWKPKDDVPVYVWIYNKGDEADKLVSARTTAADAVEVVSSDGKRRSEEIALPAHKLTQLERGKPHLLLRNVRKVIRGGDYIELTVRFRDAGSHTVRVPAQTPKYDSDSPSPSE